MPRNRGNLTGISRRERPVVVVVQQAAQPEPGTVGGGDEGGEDPGSASLPHYQAYAYAGVATITDVAGPLYPGGGVVPTLVLEQAGKYAIFASVQIEANAATAAGEVVFFGLSRANNTPAGIANTDVAITLPMAFGATSTIGTFTIPTAIYETANDDDEIVLNGVISATLSSGTIDASAISLVAIRIQ